MITNNGHVKMEHHDEHHDEEDENRKSELLDVNDDVLSLVFNHPDLLHEDMANLARTCRRAHDLVTFQHLVFYRRARGRRSLADALASGRVETINVDPETWGCHVSVRRRYFVDDVSVREMAHVGRDFPERVAKLKHVRLLTTGEWPFARDVEFPVATFPALRTIELSGEMTNPIDPGDARYVFDHVSLVRTINAPPDTFESSGGRLPALQTLARAMGDRRLRRLDFFYGGVHAGEVDAMIRVLTIMNVGRLNVFGISTRASEDATLALAPALAALPTQGLGVCSDHQGAFSAIAVRHFRVDTVRALMLSLGAPGLLVALEGRYDVTGHPVERRRLSLTLYNGYLFDPLTGHTLAAYSADDCQALVRLASRGILNELAVGSALFAPIMELVVMNAPSLRMLKFSASIEDALLIVRAIKTNASVVETLHLALTSPSDPSSTSTSSSTPSSLRDMGALMKACANLRTVSVCGSGHGSFDGFIDALTTDPSPNLKVVTVPGTSWVSAGGQRDD